MILIITPILHDKSKKRAINIRIPINPRGGIYREITMFNDNTKAAQDLDKEGAFLDGIFKFIELVNNTEKHKELHETRRKELTLTEEQEKKFKEAIEYIEEYETLAGQLKTARDQLTSDQELHLSNVEVDRREIKEAKTDIDTRETNVATGERTNKAEAKRLKDLEKELRQQYSDLVSPLDERKTQNEKDAFANEKLQEKLNKKIAKYDKLIADITAASTAKDEEEAA